MAIYGLKSKFHDLNYFEVYFIFLVPRVHYTLELIIISVCSKVFGEFIIYFHELKEASSPSFYLVPLTFEASPTTKKLKRARIHDFQRFKLPKP
jgi:hypothetical protein